jgi:ribonuclease G
VSQGIRKLKLHVHPILEGYLTKGTIFKPSIAKKWNKEHDIKIKVVSDNESPLTEYNFYDDQTDDLIKL